MIVLWYCGKGDGSQDDDDRDHDHQFEQGKATKTSRQKGRKQKAANVFPALPAYCLLLSAYCLLPVTIFLSIQRHAVRLLSARQKYSLRPTK